MPQLTITISEQQEAKILDAIQGRKDFVIEGGRVWDGERWVFLKQIRFTFHAIAPAAQALEDQLLSGE